jgi:hypothetical protein
VGTNIIKEKVMNSFLLDEMLGKEIRRERRAFAEEHNRFANQKKLVSNKILKNNVSKLLLRTSDLITSLVLGCKNFTQRISKKNEVVSNREWVSKDLGTEVKLE